MNNNKHDTEYYSLESLKFSGKVTASISHEIKNVLAIINENAGLLQDISGMIEEGFVLSPLRLNTIASKIENQITRANDIINRLNKFAHSVDNDSTEFIIFDVIEYMSKIFDRIAKMKGLKIQIENRDENYKLRTNLFVFQYLIWSCFEFSLKSINRENILNISINFDNKLNYINFKLIEDSFDEQSFETFMLNVNSLLETLPGEIILGQDKKSLKLVISI